MHRCTAHCTRHCTHHHPWYPRYLAALRAVPPGERRAWPEGDAMEAAGRGGRGDVGGDMLPRRLDMDTSF